MIQADALREIEKIRDALIWADRHFAKLSESNAALHQADRVLYSPLATAIINAAVSLDLVAEYVKHTPTGTSHSENT